MAGSFDSCGWFASRGQGYDESNAHPLCFLISIPNRSSSSRRRPGMAILCASEREPDRGLPLGPNHAKSPTWSM